MKQADFRGSTVYAVLLESAVISDNGFHLFLDNTANAKKDLQEWLNNIK